MAATWNGPRAIRRIELDHGDSARDYAQTVDVYLWIDGVWKKTLENASEKPAPFAFRNRHPIYGRFVTSLVLPEAPLAEGVKIEIVKPNTRYAWTLAEINVFVGGSSTGRSISVP